MQGQPKESCSFRAAGNQGLRRQSFANKMGEKMRSEKEIRAMKKKMEDECCNLGYCFLCRQDICEDTCETALKWVLDDGKNPKV